MDKKNSIIIKFDFISDQTVGHVKKIVGLVQARFLIPIIDNLDLEANPRSAKTGAITKAIQDSVKNDTFLFPFKTKGILLACSQYEMLNRGRVRIAPEDRAIEGILDGGHNTLAIGLYILEQAMISQDIRFPRGPKTWDQFKELWHQNRRAIDSYLEGQKDNNDGTLDFYIPVELLVPPDLNDDECTASFRNDLLEICTARNNNAELENSARSNQSGFFDDLKKLFDARERKLSIQWKTNTDGDISVQNIVALAWIPLSLIPTIEDEYGKPIEPVPERNIYSGKGTCLKQFERLMKSKKVTQKREGTPQYDLINPTVHSAFDITADIPELYDYIYAHFPSLYNKPNGRYGGINAVSALNAKMKNNKRTPFYGDPVDDLSPEGFIVPLVYGLKALMELREKDGIQCVVWKYEPKAFLENYLQEIVTDFYKDMIPTCNYDPQKVGKNPQSYKMALNGFSSVVMKKQLEDLSKSSG